MFRRVFSGLLLLAISAFSAYAPASAQSAPPQPVAPASATPAPATAQVDPKVMAMAKDWLQRIQTGNVDRSQLNDQVNSLLTPSVVQQVAAQLGPLGNPKTFSYVTSTMVNGVTIYVFLLTFKDGSMNEFLGIDGAGKIAGLRFKPVQ